MATARTRSISTKVTEAEYQQIVCWAHPQTVSEWARGVLLRANKPDPLTTGLLAEVLALRVLVVNLQFAIAQGQPLSLESFNSLIELADREKWNKAEERLDGWREKTSPAGR